MTTKNIIVILLFVMTILHLPLMGFCADGDNILSPIPHHFTGTVIDPDGVYAIDHEICIHPEVSAAITITAIKITCDADPGAELNIDLKWADAFIGLANAAIIDVCDTTSGTTSIVAGFDDATVASGKCIYWSFGAEPDAAMTQFSFDITWDYD